MPSEPDQPGAPDPDLVRAWLSVVAATAYVPRSAAEIEDLLRSLLGRLTTALAAEPFDAAAGSRVGELMVEGALTGEATLERSLRVLADGLADAGHGARSVAPLLAAVAAGYAAALRRRTLAQQENMKLALLTAKQRAERDRRATENRFREVFTASAIGIAITEQDGTFVEVNPALAAILGCPADQLPNRALAEFIAVEDSDELPVFGEADRRRLVRPNGESAWVYLTTSLLHDDNGATRYRVTMVQDLSELMLLGNQLSHQNLHDALTGAANRLHFQSRLEAMHGQTSPRHLLTLLCLDLDAFSLINTTHGHQAGDRVLRSVAGRLMNAVDGHDAVVARIGGDEFAVLIAHGTAAPPVSKLVEGINQELSEPEYDGRLGLAVSATIGVVRCKPSEMSSTEMFRAADAALRYARSTGRYQWAEFDAHADRAARKVGESATALPAAWENGELDLAYQPVVRLSDGKVVRVRALARTTGLDGVDSTTELAELTGLSVPLGPWLLAKSTESVPVWQALFAGTADPDEAVHRVHLSALQSADADLSATVNTAVSRAGVAPGLLEIALDTTTVLTGRGDAQDNLRTLSDIGVVTALHGFNGGPREIAMVERFGVRTVVLADPFENWRPDWLPRDAVPMRATLRLIEALESLGTSVGVLGVRDHAEARWWADQGVRTGEGPAFGGPGDVEDILARLRPTAN
ncbi:diguanylate cyclase [Actinokineospora auranticolor]|uniref:PAS domain S-box-containing protein/diguanylate cyclase (GGDEF)-like protein n=1 Tax=Actinokineospora auranticolor TaxID=155976 RepID=A0A2S6GBU5_9PSEU|nr:diguanylate cyclase [Actinokineospora auranticolor]PPK61332.1 PAS domain S-box-containing protein/diguanylate cyclase (GGDEF)-like protein [Actinokineospora auranticolor]